MGWATTFIVVTGGGATAAMGIAFELRDSTSGGRAVNPRGLGVFLVASDGALIGAAKLLKDREAEL